MGRILQVEAGTLSLMPDDEAWCDIHMSRTRVEGRIYRITERGVSDWGRVEGCLECEDWLWTDNRGRAIDVKSAKAGTYGTGPEEGGAGHPISC